MAPVAARLVVPHSCGLFRGLEVRVHWHSIPDRLKPELRTPEHLRAVPTQESFMPGSRRGARSRFHTIGHHGQQLLLDALTDLPALEFQTEQM